MKADTRPDSGVLKRREVGGYVICSGGSYKAVALNEDTQTPLKDVHGDCWSKCGLFECSLCHEKYHVRDLLDMDKDFCKGAGREGMMIDIDFGSYLPRDCTPADRTKAQVLGENCWRASECGAWIVTVNCMKAKYEQFLKSKTSCTHPKNGLFQCTQFLQDLAEKELQNADHRFRCYQLLGVDNDLWSIWPYKKPRRFK